MKRKGPAESPQEGGAPVRASRCRGAATAGKTGGTAGISDTTRPAWIAHDYQVLARYRRNVWRKWLFLEGEPEISWPMNEEESRHPVWGATLRVEILFTGEEPKPPAGGGGGA